MIGDGYFWVEHAFIEPSQEAKETMAFKLEQAKQKMQHSLLDGSTNYTKAAQTNIAATFARIAAKQSGKARMRKVR